MTTEQLLRLSGFILGQSGRSFEWGQRDCNTFAAGVNDILTGKRTLGKIQFQYTDAVSARRFQRNFTTAPQYLYLNGWREVTAADYSDGDILLCADRHWHMAHVVFDNLAWSVHLQQGVCGGKISHLPEFTHWRLPCQQQ